VTVDTLRADALNARDAPAMLELAARGARFSRARTPVPLTLPAHATVLSGVDPPRHSIRDNTAAPLPDRGGRDFTLLAEEFRDAGYATAAFVASSVLDPRYRLDQGFDEYRHPPPPRPGEPAFAELPAEEQVERVSVWLKTRPKNRPFFVWVHLWDPHAPYGPYAGDARGRPGTVAADPDAERYAGEVRRVDAAVEALLAAVDAATTVVVLTSDHGESLGEHGEKTHGYVCYGATMDVPLVVAGPGVPAGERDAPCALADVAPTLRRLCGLDARDSDGRDLFESSKERVVCGESLYANRLFGWAQQSVAFDGRFSLVDGGPRLELFDRDRDPGETSPLPDPTGHPAYARLDPALMEYRSRRRASSDAAEIAAAPIYYGSLREPVGDFSKPAKNRRLRDVREEWDTIALLDRVTRLTAARAADPLRALLPRLEALERAQPENAAPSLARGRALLLVLGEPERAAEALEEARRRGYGGLDLDRLIARARSDGKKPPR